MTETAGSKGPSSRAVLVEEARGLSSEVTKRGREEGGSGTATLALRLGLWRVASGARPGQGRSLSLAGQVSIGLRLVTGLTTISRARASAKDCLKVRGNCLRREEVRRRQGGRTRPTRRRQAIFSSLANETFCCEETGAGVLSGRESSFALSARISSEGRSAKTATSRNIARNATRT